MGLCLTRALGGEEEQADGMPLMPDEMSDAEKLPAGDVMMGVTPPDLTTSQPVIAPPPKLNLTRVDTKGDETETGESRRQAKLDYFHTQLSEITPWLFLGSDVIARDKEKLKAAGVTHILNTAGDVCDNYHPNDFTYKTLHLADGTSEDIECVFYDVIDFLNQATDTAGTTRKGQAHRGFVHCWQGVSRSSSCCILFLMLHNNWDYDTSYQYVRGRRGVVRPNVAFLVQLQMWHKRHSEGTDKPRLYLVTKQSPQQANFLTAKAFTTRTTSADLDPSKCCVLQTPTRLFIWQGEDCGPRHIETATKHAERLIQYEQARDYEVIQQGSEPDDFWGSFSDGKSGFGSRIGNRPPPIAEIGRLDSEVEIVRPKPVFHHPAGHDDGDDNLNPRMFEHPSWEEINMFDSDDLAPDGVFVIFSNHTSDGGSDFVYVWCGEDADVRPDHAEPLAAECLQIINLNCPSHVTVVAQDHEDDRFWSLFKSG